MKKTIKIDGMSCNHCVMSVKKNLSKLELKEFKVEIGSVDVEFDERKINEKEIIESIEDAGYQVVK
ncbi:MAG: cation transporter [Ignavibacteria bacterium]|nr:cation transporter [Ignavibacteria bacterium]